MREEAERNRQRRHEDYINLQTSIFERIFTVQRAAQENVQVNVQDNVQEEDEDSYNE